MKEAAVATADAPPRAPARSHADKAAPGAGRSFRLGWARGPADVRAAQRLRFEVFAGEMGAHLRVPPGTPPGHDADDLDPYCEHLLARATGGPAHGSVVATCRILTPEGARRAGRLYTDGEFDLGPLRRELHRVLEMGRICVHPDWRNGLLVMALWQELAQQLVQRGLDTFIGCTSVTAADGGALAARVWRALSEAQPGGAPQRVLPRHPLPLQALPAAAPDEAPVDVPVLLRAYLRCGGTLLGPPALDRDFQVADFPVMLRLADIPPRYGRRIFAA